MARPAGAAGSFLIAVTGPGIFIGDTEPEAFMQDVSLCHIDERSKEGDFCRVLCSQIDHALECFNELWATVRIPAVIERLNPDENCICIPCFSKTRCNREQVCIPERDVGVRHMGCLLYTSDAA